MASGRFLTAFLIVMASIVGLYIFDVTFGAAMDQLYYTFTNLTPTLALSANWNTTATNQLSHWRLFYRSFVIIVIALGVWLVRVAIVDVDYTRQY